MIEPGVLLQNRYRIVKQIGEGGMGAVYVATDERFQSTVAIKQTFFDDPTLRKAFEREAHLLNHLRHVALPKVSDHFVEGDGQFLVMDFIEGEELAELLQRRGAFPLADVLRWADELLDALEYLHTHEPPIVHRDIKPQNMKLTSRGQIVLLDFGLAKGAATGTRAGATAASVFGYSRSYAPLEQIQGTGTDTRSDLYSLGATLYHLLTGVAPVDGLTRAGAVINNQPDPLRPAHLAHAQVPESISKILHRALNLKAALRPATAAEMRAALRQATGVLSRTTPQAATVHTQGQARHEATMLDGRTQMFGGQHAAPSTLSQTRMRPPSSLTENEATIVDSSLERTRPASKPHSHTSFQTPPAEEARKKSPAMIIGISLAVLVACAFIAFPLLRRSPAASPAASETQTITLPGGGAQTVAPDTTQAEATHQTSDSTSLTGGRALSSEGRAGGESQSPASRASSGEAEGSVGSAVNADAVTNLSPVAEASDNKSGLVIQSPAPGSQAGVKNNAAAEYDAQRAEDLRRRKEQQALELQQQRQREQFRPPHPAPHEGGHPLPGGGHRPPPHRPPPMH